jgi:hypothetical protein
VSVLKQRNQTRQTNTTTETETGEEGTQVAEGESPVVKTMHVISISFPAKNESISVKTESVIPGVGTARSSSSSSKSSQQQTQVLSSDQTSETSSSKRSGFNQTSQSQSEQRDSNDFFSDNIDGRSPNVQTLQQQGSPLASNSSQKSRLDQTTKKPNSNSTSEDTQKMLASMVQDLFNGRTPHFPSGTMPLEPFPLEDVEQYRPFPNGDVPQNGGLQDRSSLFPLDTSPPSSHFPFLPNESQQEDPNSFLPEQLSPQSAGVFPNQGAGDFQDYQTYDSPEVLRQQNRKPQNSQSQNLPQENRYNADSTAFSPNIRNPNPNQSTPNPNQSPTQRQNGGSIAPAQFSSPIVGLQSPVNGRFSGANPPSAGNSGYPNSHGQPVPGTTSGNVPHQQGHQIQTSQGQYPSQEQDSVSYGNNPQPNYQGNYPSQYFGSAGNNNKPSKDLSGNPTGFGYNPNQNVAYNPNPNTGYSPDQNTGYNPNSNSVHNSNQNSGYPSYSPQAGTSRGQHYPSQNQVGYNSYNPSPQSSYTGYDSSFNNYYQPASYSYPSQSNPGPQFQPYTNYQSQPYTNSQSQAYPNLQSQLYPNSQSQSYPYSQFQSYPNSQSQLYPNWQFQPYSGSYTGVYSGSGLVGASAGTGNVGYGTSPTGSQTQNGFPTGFSGSNTNNFGTPSNTGFNNYNPSSNTGSTGSNSYNPYSSGSNNNTPFSGSNTGFGSNTGGGAQGNSGQQGRRTHKSLILCLKFKLADFQTP